jgi:hypothetical protein
MTYIDNPAAQGSAAAASDNAVERAYTTFRKLENTVYGYEAVTRHIAAFRNLDAAFVQLAGVNEDAAEAIQDEIIRLAKDAQRFADER